MMEAFQEVLTSSATENCSSKFFVDDAKKRREYFVYCRAFLAVSAENRPDRARG